MELVTLNHQTETIMKTTSYTKTILKIGKLFIGVESRNYLKGNKVLFIDFGSVNILEYKY